MLSSLLRIQFEILNVPLCLCGVCLVMGEDRKLTNSLIYNAQGEGMRYVGGSGSGVEV